MTFPGRLTTVATLTALLGSTSAYSQDDFTWFGQSATGNWMAGLKMESVSHGRGGYEDASNVGLVLGYEFDRPIGFDGSSSIEFELTDSFDKGDVSTDSIFGVGGEWQAENIGMYFTYKTPGNVYFKVKLGALRSDVTTKLDGSAAVREQDTSFSYGGGLGLKLGQTGNFNLELEVVGTSGDNDLNMISLGGIYKFP